jgi:hypothetical protein
MSFVLFINTTQIGKLPNLLSFQLVFLTNTAIHPEKTKNPLRKSPKGIATPVCALARNDITV